MCKYYSDIITVVLGEREDKYKALHPHFVKLEGIIWR